jgi:hypothetical protein
LATEDRSRIRLPRHRRRVRCVMSDPLACLEGKLTSEHLSRIGSGRIGFSISTERLFHIRYRHFSREARRGREGRHSFMERNGIEGVSIPMLRLRASTSLNTSTSAETTSGRPNNVGIPTDHGMVRVVMTVNLESQPRAFSELPSLHVSSTDGLCTLGDTLPTCAGCPGQRSNWDEGANQQTTRELPEGTLLVIVSVLC